MSVLTSRSSRNRKQRVRCSSVIWNWKFLVHCSSGPVSGPPADSSPPSALPSPPRDHASSRVVRCQSSSGLISEKPKSGMPSSSRSSERMDSRKSDSRPGSNIKGIRMYGVGDDFSKVYSTVTWREKRGSLQKTKSPPSSSSPSLSTSLRRLKSVGFWLPLKM
eukprot:scaffold4306_cov114-Isochrysis_galbana.AAC.10